MKHFSAFSVGKSHYDIEFIANSIAVRTSYFSKKKGNRFAFFMV